YAMSRLLKVLYMCLELFVYLFFFFQAEDGIRDFHVTGVQTCALPILSRACGGTPGPAPRAARARARESGFRRSRRGSRRAPRSRSEERRVGKEWRTGWSR